MEYAAQNSVTNGHVTCQITQKQCWKYSTTTIIQTVTTLCIKQPVM